MSGYGGEVSGGLTSYSSCSNNLLMQVKTFVEEMTSGGHQRYLDITPDRKNIYGDLLNKANIGADPYVWKEGELLHSLKLLEEECSWVMSEESRKRGSLPDSHKALLVCLELSRAVVFNSIPGKDCSGNFTDYGNKKDVLYTELRGSYWNNICAKIFQIGKLPDRVLNVDEAIKRLELIASLEDSTDKNTKYVAALAKFQIALHLIKKGLKNGDDIRKANDNLYGAARIIAQLQSSDVEDVAKLFDSEKTEERFRRIQGTVCEFALLYMQANGTFNLASTNSEIKENAKLFFSACCKVGNLKFAAYASNLPLNCGLGSFLDMERFVSMVLSSSPDTTHGFNRALQLISVDISGCSFDDNSLKGSIICGCSGANTLNINQESHPQLWQALEQNIRQDMREKGLEDISATEKLLTRQEDKNLFKRITTDMLWNLLVKGIKRTNSAPKVNALYINAAATTPCYNNSRSAPTSLSSSPTKSAVLSVQASSQTPPLNQRSNQMSN